jgi:hypothetical protein|tara:strand:- start:892 stop:1095 length:204 start_codon:yes stop_codon:yes gene_type:complete
MFKIIDKKRDKYSNDWFVVMVNVIDNDLTPFATHLYHPNFEDRGELFVSGHYCYTYGQAREDFNKRQ